MIRTHRRLAALCLGFALLAPAAAAQDKPAKELFGAVATPAPLAARSIGSYARGCLAGAEALPIDGRNWQVMRLSRNRNWGHPRLVAFLERFARDAAEKDGWPGLLVGDLSQPRGGPMRSGHASHQVGLDADIWLLPMPDHTLSRTEREETSAISVLRKGTRELDPARWDEAMARLVRRAALDPEVARIFVNPAIKQALCAWAGDDRAWLRQVRPWYGHDDHIHVRLDCPPGQAGCTPQAVPPPGDGCGSELAWWLGPEPYKPPTTPPKPTPPMRLSGLPDACRSVLTAGEGGLALPEAAMPPLPKPRPNG